jgi:hypothetical protein
VCRCSWNVTDGDRWNVRAVLDVLPVELDIVDELLVSATTRRDALEEFRAWWRRREWTPRKISIGLCATRDGLTHKCGHRV